jgi:hypothetical protein
MIAMQNAQGLVVGISDYQYVNKLPTTVVKDAADVGRLLTDPNHCAYPPENVPILVDGQATQPALRQALTCLAQRSTADSTVFLYLSCHGGRIESGPCAGEYLLPVDTVYTSAESLAGSAISGNEFTEVLRAIPARKLVVALDCCHSGGIGQPKDALTPELKAIPESYYETLKSGGDE